jgi:hypothetical protein
MLANVSMLFGLVMTRPSHASDGAAKSVLAMMCCRHRVMLAMMPLSWCWLSLIRVPSTLIRVLSSTIRVPPLTAKVSIDRRGVIANH